MSKIAIIIGSLREGRLGEPVAQWVAAQAVGRGAEYDLVDLRDFPLPLLDAAVVPNQANKNYADPQVQKWADKVDEFDGFVFVTPEYNHNVPGPFKNAFDSIAGEWMGKPVAVVAYSFGGGVDAVAGWRKTVTGALQMPFVEETTIAIPENFGEAGFAPTEAVAAQLGRSLDALEQAITE